MQTQGESLCCYNTRSPANNHANSGQGLQLVGLGIEPREGGRFLIRVPRLLLFKVKRRPDLQLEAGQAISIYSKAP